MKGLIPRVFETRAIDRYANPPQVKSLCAPEWGRTTKPLDPQSNALSIELRVHYYRILVHLRPNGKPKKSDPLESYGKANLLTFP